MDIKDCKIGMVLVPTKYYALSYRHGLTCTVLCVGSSKIFVLNDLGEEGLVSCLNDFEERPKPPVVTKKYANAYIFNAFFAAYSTREEALSNRTLGPDCSQPTHIVCYTFHDGVLHSVELEKL